MEWLSKSNQIQKNLAAHWHLYLIALLLFSFIVGLHYYKKTADTNALMNSAQVHRNKADSLITTSSILNKAITKSQKNVQNSENERVHKNYTIDTLIPDSLQSELDREFNFPLPRPPNR